MEFSYTAVDNTPTGLAPRLALTLRYGQNAIEINGLLDSGSAVNLLPHPVGLALGAVWAEQPLLEPVAGSFGHLEARGLAVLASHPQLTGNEPVRLVFAWALTQDVPVLFGQVNFFMEFEICFYRTQSYFEIKRSKLH